MMVVTAEVATGVDREATAAEEAEVVSEGAAAVVVATEAAGAEAEEEVEEEEEEAIRDGRTGISQYILGVLRARLVKHGARRWCGLAVAGGHSLCCRSRGL